MSATTVQKNARNRSCGIDTSHATEAAALTRRTQPKLRHRNEKDKRLGGDNTQQTETQEFKGFKRIQIELLGRTMLTHTKQTELRRGVSHTEMVMHECPRTE